MICRFALTLSLCAFAVLALPAHAHGPSGKGSAAFEAYEKGNIPEGYKKRRNPLKATQEITEKGMAVYQQNCVMCHGVNADGQGHMSQMMQQKPADLRQMFKHSPEIDDYYFWIISEGGTQFDIPMPGFSGSLSEEEIWQVVTWMQAGFPGAGGSVQGQMPHQGMGHGSGGHMMDNPQGGMPHMGTRPGN